MIVRFLDFARFQLAEAIEYIAFDSPAAARELEARIDRALRRLEQFLESGRHIPEFPDRVDDREVIITPYRLFYRIDGQTIWITALWHGAQHVPEAETAQD
jgi:plasmid stabilization system protein ParE